MVQYLIEMKLAALRDTYGIKDKNGNLLGYVKKQVISWGPKFWFEGTDGTRHGEIHGKLLTIRPTFEIYDSYNQLKGVVKKKMMKFLGSEWWMENPLGLEVMRAKGNVMKHDYQLLTPDGKTLAQVHKKWASIRDSYCIDVLQPDYDRLLILSYIIAMDQTEVQVYHRQ